MMACAAPAMSRAGCGAGRPVGHAAEYDDEAAVRRMGMGDDSSEINDLNADKCNEHTHILNAYINNECMNKTTRTMRSDFSHDLQ